MHKPCPICGKPMGEEPYFPGLWTCPDYKIPVNDSPPYEFKCTGSEMTQVAVDALDRELHRLWAERN